jgi:hypothetical protein
MSQLQDSILQLVNEELSNSTGVFNHTGDYNINGTLTANTINVSNLIANGGNVFNVGNWSGNLESEINGKGFNWTWAEGSTSLVYRTGGRLWTNGAFDIAPTSSYNIDNVPVLSSGTLGPSITNSSLTKLGTLNSLAVGGDAVLGDFAYFNSSFNRLGIGTDEPNAALNILDNNVDIIIGSPSVNIASMGTYSSHDLAIVTDNLTRITIKNNGVVNIGDPVNGGGSLNVYGTLYASNLQVDNRVERTHPMQFNASSDTPIYGLGIQWVGTGATRQFIMASAPDRLFSTESIDIGENQSYYVNGQVALGANTLGPTITNSSLTKLGALQSLNVTGNAVFIGGIDASQSLVKVQSILINNGANDIEVTPTGITSNTSVAIKSQNSNVVSGDSTQISIGSNTLQSKPVKVFGPLSVNVNNPDPSLQFTVNGDVSIGGKRFTSGPAIPTSGIFNIGDMCWNTRPGPNNYVGWVCITAGTPGQWLGFGMIAAQ